MRSAMMLVGAATALSAACSDSTKPSGIHSPPTEVAMDIVSGGSQTATVGQSLAQPLVVKVVDKNLRIPVPGYLVNWIITTGGGSMWVSSTITNLQGVTQNFWTLGPDIGLQHVEVRAISPFTGEKLVFGTFSATATGSGVIPGHMYHFEQRYDGGHAIAGVPWNFKDHVQTLLVDDQTGLAAMSMNFWVTAAPGCTWTDTSITCPTSGVVHVAFQQDGFDGVDNPAFRPAIDLVVE